jgi:hypothetical protein
MIVFLTTARYQYIADRYLRSWGRPFLLTIQPFTYEQFLRRRTYRPGAYVFADIDRLSEDDRWRAQDAWQTLRRLSEPCVLLNEPAACLRRYDLLATLHARGTNTFRAHHLDAPPAAIRFPVFLRVESDHAGNRTGLLSTPEALASAIAGLRAQGTRLDDWLIVEFCDTADADGLYRKYSAFRVGDRIIPIHVFIGRDWCLKHRSALPVHSEEEEAYTAGNPHRRELMELFELARIDYGRIDYTPFQGRLCVWEINTNPALPWEQHRDEACRRDVSARFAQQLASTWRELDRSVGVRRAYPTAWLRTAMRLSRVSSVLERGRKLAAAALGEEA